MRDNSSHNDKAALCTTSETIETSENLFRSNDQCKFEQYMQYQKFKMAEKRRNETPEQKKTRLYKNRLSTAQSRINESVLKKKPRLDKTRISMAQKRTSETSIEKKERLEKLKAYAIKKEESETPEDAACRLLCDRSYQHKKRKMRSPDETQYIKLTDQERKRCKHTHPIHVEDELDKIRRDINQKTHFAYICVSDLRYHSLGNVVKMKLASETTESTGKEPNDTDKSHNEATNPNSKNSFTEHEKVNYDKSTTQPCEQDNKQKCKNDLLISKTIVNEDTKSFDGHWYICHACKRTIEKKNIPPCNEKEYKFHVPELPDYLTDNGMALNKYEAHLLKLIIPFVRVSHIPKSSEFKVLGPVICVESNLNETFDKILPINQDLIPVALKRRPEYKSTYIEEVISKSKILKYFQYLKANNPLYADIEFSEDKLNSFLLETMENIAEQDEWKTSQENANVEESEHEIQRDTAQDDSGTEDDIEMDIDVQTNKRKTTYPTDQPHIQIQNGKVDSNRSEELVTDDETIEENNETDENSETMANNNYDLPKYINEINDDTVIDPLTKNENRQDISELIANAIIEHEQIRKKTKTEWMTRIDIAPGAEGKFVKNWEKVQYLEEKAFPHLFPTGTGGYLSTYLVEDKENGNKAKKRKLVLPIT
jgi:hypothetical protein